jgi:hypothetical protein
MIKSDTLAHQHTLGIVSKKLVQMGTDCSLTQRHSLIIFWMNMQVVVHFLICHVV